MPKPTLFQAVLRKPTRSYADPQAASPWSDYDYPSAQPSPYAPAQSRYTAQRDGGVHLGYRDGPNEAGPSSRRARPSPSVVSDTQVSSSSRFPAPRKVSSMVALREEGQYEVERVRTVKKKPKKRIDEMSVVSMDALSVDSRRMPRGTNSRMSSRTNSSEVSLAHPPPFRAHSDTGTSSTRSSPIPQLPPVMEKQYNLPAARPGLTVVQKAIARGITPPLTPPASEPSSEQSSRYRVPLPIVVPPMTVPPIPTKSPKRLSIVSSHTEESEEETFHTPASSMDNSPAVAAERTLRPILPVLSLQPPTPAPVPDPVASPFHSEQTSTNSLFTTSSGSRTDSKTEMQHEDDDDAHSAKGEAGSDDDDESERRESSAKNSRQNSFTQPAFRPDSRPSSRAPSVVHLGPGASRSGSRTPSIALSAGDDHRSPSRASTRRHTTRNSFDDFVVRRNSMAASEMSFAPEGSVRSVSGYGKGGWAAAAASGSKSGRSSPVVMYMPTSGNDGWAGFQPPPRQSKFTPLPAASQPATFNRIVHGTTPNGSMPSSYSQESDEDSEEEPDAPLPSRSYRRTDYASENGYSESQASIPDTEDRFYQALRQRQLSLGTAVDPYAVPNTPRAPSVMSVPPPAPRDVNSYRQPSHRSSYNGSYDSRPVQRETNLQRYDSRPTSPIPSRPSSRMGFDPPSFLNPDTLTLLPEMSAEDSAKTYIPSEPVRPPRRPASAFGGFSRSGKSEADYEDERDEVPDLPKRAKSAMGHRDNASSRWEGSSAGEGVLMESHGRGSEHVTGYSNLILPSGAFKPAKPSSASSTALDSRILGMPHASMAGIVLSTLPSHDTPIHLRDQNPPVDFVSHLRPPSKVTNSQILVQMYATAIDKADIRALYEKGRGDISRWVPGRSFVGRCMAVGAEEKEIVRGDIVIGLMELRKSGALSEYIICDRRRIARAPYPTSLTLEQLSLLPLQGIAAARAVRTHLVRNSRALLMGAHEGVSAMICQELSRAGVSVTAVISGGEDAFQAQTACMANGARGVLTGSPAAVMLGLDEGGWDFVLDTQGGQRIYDAAKRLLKNDGKLLTLADPSSITTTSPTHSRSSGFKTFKAAFGNKKKDVKTIQFEHLPASGSGEPAVDSSGVDCRDVLEESCMSAFRPVVNLVVPLERGAEVFKHEEGGIVRLVN